MDAASQALFHPGGAIILHIPFSPFILSFSSPHVHSFNGFFTYSLQLSTPNPLFSAWFWRSAKVSLKFNDQSLAFLFDLGRATLKVLGTVERYRVT